MLLRKKRILTIVSGLLILKLNIAHANIPNIIGTYSGSETDNRFSCTNPADNGTFQSDLVLFINVQNGSAFSGTDRDGAPFSGQIDAAGNFNGSYSHSDGGNGTFSGSISSGGTWNSSSTVVTPGSDGCLGSGTQTLTRSSGGAITAQVEQSRQIVRNTNTLISQHLATEVSKAFSFNPGFEHNNFHQGASSDQSNNQISFWGTTSISEIHNDADTVADFDTDIYQFVGGVDNKFGNYFLGTALTYAYSETEQTGQDSNTQVFGITPYGAYSVTDYMFISALAGYNYSYIREELSGNDSDVHDYILESNINLYKVFIDALIVKSRFGVRFHHSYVGSRNKPLDATADELIWLGDVELGYRLQNGLISYLGLNYEYFDREASVQDIKEHDGILYMRGGFDYPIHDKLTLGAKVQADLNDEDNDIITGSFTLRLAL